MVELKEMLVLMFSSFIIGVVFMGMWLLGDLTNPINAEILWKVFYFIIGLAICNIIAVVGSYLHTKIMNKKEMLESNYITK